MAPPTFNREVDEDSMDTGAEGPYARVLACAYSPDKTVPAFCCFLDGSGQVTDFLRLNNLLKRKYSPFDREREEKVRYRCIPMFEPFIWYCPVHTMQYMHVQSLRVCVENSG